MDKEVSLYHQLVEHPFFVFLVGSLLLMIIIVAFGIVVHRLSERRTEASRTKADAVIDDDSVKD